MKIIIEPNWQSVSNIPSWSTLTTRELADVLNTNIININNWVCRGQFPEPEKRYKGQGNKNHFRISKIRSWLEGRSENEIHEEWISKNLNHLGKLPTIEQAQDLVKSCWKILEVKQPT